MKASIVDLRYKMPEVLSALSRREKVQILYHGKLKGITHPAGGGGKSKAADHPFFGMFSADQEPIAEIMGRLRGGRHRDL